MLTVNANLRICGEATTGAEAVDKAIALKPDIIVMDFSLPELNGLDATRRIRHALPATEVLMLTANTSETLIKDVFSAGAKALVAKTDTRRHLLPALKSLARHKPFLTPAASAAVLNGFLASETSRGGRGRWGRNNHLTQRQREIVRLIAEGSISKEIASKLRISVRTVEAHRLNIMRKLDLHSVSGLVCYAVRHHITEVEAGNNRFGESGLVQGEFENGAGTASSRRCGTENPDNVRTSRPHPYLGPI
jgi:DNA-binding NarL/FixJ family response regulator